MNLTKVEEPYVLDELVLLRGKPIPFYDICMIYPVTMGDIADMTEIKFRQYLKFLTAKPSEYKMPEDITPIEFMTKIAANSKDFNIIMREAFKMVTHEDITPLPDILAICVGDISQRRLLTDDNFETFQYILKRLHNLPAENKYDSPANDRAKEIINKIQRSRAIVDRIKSQRGDEEVELSALISSLGWKVGLDNVWKMPYYAFDDQIHRMQYDEEYEMNFRASLAGAKIPKDKLKYWMTRSTNSNKGG